jgi:uracil-DNA glycosylase family 4
VGGEVEEIGTPELRSALSWWLEAGVDVATDETPRNWLKPSPAANPATNITMKERPSAPAEKIAPPDGFEAFSEWLRDNAELPYASKGARKILPVGPAQPEVMLLTGMPPLDRQADEGPIGGEAWILAQRMMAAIGIEPAATYRASLSCFHTMSGFAPGAQLDACVDLARRQVALVKPKRLLLLGEEPCRALLGKPLAAARGHVQKIEGVRTVATFDPSFLILHPLQKEAAWSDLLLLTEDE